MASPYCEVALPVPLRTTFTYAVPPALAGALEPGSRVVVPFRNRALVGVALELTHRRPALDQVKEIVEILDPMPALPASLVALGRWVANYYLAPPGDVFRAMLPPAVEVRAERVLELTQAGRVFLGELENRDNRSEAEVAELGLLQLLEVSDEPVPQNRLRKLPGGQAAAARLLRRGLIAGREVARRRAPRTQKIVAWDPEATPDNAREVAVFELLTRARGPSPLAQVAAESGVSRRRIERMERAGKLRAWQEPLTADEEWLEAEYVPPLNVLNAEQRSALSEIRGWLESGRFTTGLLYGVTGSGKTEVYLGAIEAALVRGRAALVLVPEIALTLWVQRLCRARLGDTVAVLHSGLPETERAAEWWRARRGEARVVVGTRSAVFAPLENLGLLIVDEEQEASYKQEESPRYHARDTAVMRAKLESAVAVLGSATPSLESYHNARGGKYRLLQLESRVENRPLAPVEGVDMRAEFRRAQPRSRGAAISERLRAALQQRLNESTQALVLLNRRGYSWFVLCRSCGASVQCENCSISLTYHKRRERLVCHYCGFARRVPPRCPKCESEHIYYVGEGAEQVEEQLRGLFPRARVARLDRDTARTKSQYIRVLSAFARGDIDLLVGTQMVAKGHDFERVTLVGVVSADLLLGLPDFRAAERTFQLLTQVAGRAGRGRLPGEVVVQTYFPEHYAIQFAARQDYPAFFDKELHFRRVMHYPPFTALASVTVRDRKIETAIRWVRAIGGFLAQEDTTGMKVLGPAVAPLARLRREFRFQFLLKSPRRGTLTHILARCLDFCAEKEIPDSAVLVDVDPISLF